MEEDLERELARNEAANRMAKEREEQALAARLRFPAFLFFSTLWLAHKNNQISEDWLAEIIQINSSDWLIQNFCPDWLIEIERSEMEFKEFEPRFKSAKTRFKLSAGLNLETFDTILSGTNHI